jgi:predicted transcriptional regulator of viral defense system
MGIHVSVLDAFVTRRRPARTLAGARVVFHVLAKRLMDYGVTQSTIEGLSVHISDLERTLLDVLDHPRMVGGVGRAVDLFSTSLPRATAATLVDYAIRGSRMSTCQRLGVILERNHAPASALRRLASRVEGSRSMISLVPGPRTGKFNSKWSVVENDHGMVSTSPP